MNYQTLPPYQEWFVYALYRESSPETIDAFERAGTGIGIWAKGKPAPVSWHCALCDNTIALHDLGIIYRHVRGCLYAPREVAQA